jgi:hypothetical protein
VGGCFCDEGVAFEAVGRRVFQAFTLVLLLVTGWTAYANVISDDMDVRNKARAAVNQAAGCGNDCKLEGLRGERGMFEERIEYDVVKRGHFVVVCRREHVALGDYACTVTESPPAKP